MRKPELVQENKMHDIFWDFEIKMDPLITTRKPDLVKRRKEFC